MKNEALTVCLLLGSLGSALGGLVPEVTGDADLIRLSPHQAYYRVSVFAVRGGGQTGFVLDFPVRTLSGFYEKTDFG